MNFCFSIHSGQTPGQSHKNKTHEQERERRIGNASLRNSLYIVFIAIVRFFSFSIFLKFSYDFTLLKRIIMPNNFSVCILLFMKAKPASLHH
jgi:hypothetical protein